MRRRERNSYNEDQLSFRWETPRPSYMREIEPLAHREAWRDPGPMATDTPEQRENREILEAAMKRKKPSAVSSQPSAERKMG
jgi:hypothetical protein